MKKNTIIILSVSICSILGTLILIIFLKGSGFSLGKQLIGLAIGAALIITALAIIRYDIHK